MRLQSPGELPGQGNHECALHTYPSHTLKHNACTPTGCNSTPFIILFGPIILLALAICIETGRTHIENILGFNSPDATLRTRPSVSLWLDIKTHTNTVGPCLHHHVVDITTDIQNQSRMLQRTVVTLSLQATDLRSTALLSPLLEGFRVDYLRIILLSRIPYNLLRVWDCPKICHLEISIPFKKIFCLYWFHIPSPSSSLIRVYGFM